LLGLKLGVLSVLDDSGWPDTKENLEISSLEGWEELVEVTTLSGGVHADVLGAGADDGKLLLVVGGLLALSVGTLVAEGETELAFSGSGSGGDEGSEGEGEEGETEELHCCGCCCFCLD